MPDEAEPMVYDVCPKYGVNVMEQFPGPVEPDVTLTASALVSLI
jgi:hypothetical protein